MHEIILGLIITVGGSLINFISTKIYNHFTGDSKNFIWRDKTVDLKSLKVPAEFGELKKRTRIVVIDDEDGFPVNLFQAEGYSIDKWKTVTDYSKLEIGFYDIIILDIKGVAQHISEEDGLGVLISLKKKNPAQIIISYSQYSYDLNKIRFFQLADENIAKPSDFLKIKDLLDNLILTRFKPERYITELNKVLHKNNISEKEISKLNNEIAKAINSKSKPDWKRILGFVQDKTELEKQLVSLGETIFKFYY
jgi:hypothetical protein